MDRATYNYATVRYDGWCRFRAWWVAPLLVAFALALFCRAVPAIGVFGVACTWWGFADIRARHWYGIWRRGVDRA